MKKSNDAQKSGTGMKIAIIVGIVVIIILLIVIIVFLTRRKETKAEVKRNVVVTQDNVEQVAEEMVNQSYVAPGYYATRMSTTWHFSRGNAVSEDAYVENAPDNTNTVTWKYEDPDAQETDVAPSIVTKSYTYDQSADLEITVDLGKGDKAAEGVAKVYRYASDTSSTTTELSGSTKWSYADGKLTFKAGQFSSNTTGDKRYIKVVFDDDEETAVDIELVVK